MPVAVMALLLLLSTSAVSACAQPAAGHPASPLPGCPQAHLRQPSGGYTLTGPAVGSLTGAAAQSSFSLDGGVLSIRPPAAGQRPIVSAATATCAALASSDPDNASFGEDARAGGMVYGYGRVTLRDSGRPAERLLTLHAATVTGSLPATLRHAPTGLVMAEPPPEGPPTATAVPATR